jgi:CelD/BcsL family acetyltransferase involved in cellulose biosynthesis
VAIAPDKQSRARRPLESPGRLEGKVLDSFATIEPYRDAWDRLAVEARRPYSAPAWGLAWWRHAGPPHAELRVVAVLDGERLAGVAPMYVERRAGPACYRFLASEISARVEPVAEAARTPEVAAVIAATLARTGPLPQLLRFDGVPADSPWPALLRSAWPGARQPWIHREQSKPAPVVSLDRESFDAWMKSKSSNFRQQMRRGRRQLERQGAVFRAAATESELDRDLDAFARLHRERWEPRGGSTALRPGVEAMLRAAGSELMPRGRYRLESISLGGEIVGSHLFVEAGGEVSYWLGGFDERWASQHPSMVALVAAVEDGLRSGNARLDLGPGGQGYKYRLADGEDLLEWIALAPISRGYLSARASLAPTQLRREIATRTPPEWKGRLRAAFARLQVVLGRAGSSERRDPR